MDYSRDLVRAILTTSVSLGGLVLVFSGFLLSQANSFPPETPDKTIDRYRYGAQFGVGLVVACLLLTWLSAKWLAAPSDSLFAWSWLGFQCMLAGAAVYAVWALLYLMRP